MKTPMIKDVTPIIRKSSSLNPYDLTNDNDLAKILKLMLKRAFVIKDGALAYKNGYHRERVALLLGNIMDYICYITFDNFILLSEESGYFELYKIEEVKEILDYEYKKLLTKGILWDII